MSDRLDEIARRRPHVELEVTLTPEAKAEFQARGFTRVERITTDEELAWLREVYDALFDPQTELVPGAIVRDVMVRLDEQRGDRQAQILRPEWTFAALKETAFWRNGRRLAAELLALDTRAMEGWGHLVMKAARDPEALPWHQDEAFWDPRFDYRAAGCWAPLDPATVESGCMRMIPGSHLDGIRPHAYPNDDPAITTLFCPDVPETEAVAHPVPIGGASFHHCRTLHGSGPNRTDHVRRALVTEWQAAPVRRDTPVERPWYWAREKAARAHFYGYPAGA